ncbi:MAG: nucleotidyltransferase domain-containing protein [Bacteroidales bacterium]|nr:nucleotidyltransferase domain-containing protein [Lentimicrobiaceae bacterium]MDD5695036.1 nucleotidyltransferase domain-containing protein [Bacteroidales bacterium]
MCQVYHFGWIFKVEEYSLLGRKHFDLDKVVLFGSYARGESNENSDIDVAVIVNSLTDFTV